MCSIVKISIFLVLIVSINGIPISGNNQLLNVRNNTATVHVSNGSNGVLTQGNGDFFSQLLSFLFGSDMSDGLDIGLDYGTRDDYNWDTSSQSEKGRNDYNSNSGSSGNSGSNSNFGSNGNSGFNGNSRSNGNSGYMTQQEWAQYMQLIQALSQEGGDGGGGGGFGDAGQLINTAMGMLGGF